MSKIKNGGLDQYGDEPVKQRQFGTAGVEGVKQHITHRDKLYHIYWRWEARRQCPCHPWQQLHVELYLLVSVGWHHSQHPVTGCHSQPHVIECLNKTVHFMPWYCCCYCVLISHIIHWLVQVTCSCTQHSCICFMCANWLYLTFNVLSLGHNLLNPALLYATILINLLTYLLTYLLTHLLTYLLTYIHTLHRTDTSAALVNLIYQLNWTEHLAATQLN